MAYIGSKPADKPVVASDLDPTIITGQTALATAPADTDEFLISDAGVLKRLDASLVGGGGITVADNWRLTADVTSDTDATGITANLEQVDTNGQGNLGTSMSVSSGVFTFPETGTYFIDYSAMITANGNDNVVILLYATTDNSSYSVVCKSFAGASANNLINAHCNTLLNVTNTSNVKVKFSVSSLNSGSTLMGDTSVTETGFVFIRLGDST